MENKFKNGDKVIHKSGGQPMVVIGDKHTFNEKSQRYDKLTYECTWMDSENNYHKSHLYEEELEFFNSHNPQS